MIFTWNLRAQDLTDNIKNNITHSLIVFGIRTVNMVIVTLQDVRQKRVLHQDDIVVKNQKNGRSDLFYILSILTIL